MTRPLQILCFVLVMVSPVGASAQHDDITYADKVYVDHINSVRFHISGLLTSYPLIDLAKGSSLQLRFDDLQADSKYYTYSVVHCNRDWTPSDLNFNEYVDGFEDEPIDDLEQAINTYINYTHYAVRLPNEDFRITKSGNYVLIIREDGGDPVITRRFMVVDPKATIFPTMVRPANVSKLRTHHEVDFIVGTKNVRIINPKQEISVSVLQNGRWDNAITDIRSKYERVDELFFDYQDKIAFAAGMDFRNLDIRSTQYRSRSIFEIERTEDGVRLIAALDAPRAYQRYLSTIDINGLYVIQSADDRRFTTARIFNEEAVEEMIQYDLAEHHLESDYVEVLFTLGVDEPYDQDVYIFGALSDWQLQERFRMTYDADHQAYFGSAWLKQGFYDYIYTLANTDGTPDETTIEGHWYEASNNYTILVYQTAFGGRYDQLIGAVTVGSSL